MSIKPTDMENYILTTAIFYKANSRTEDAKAREDGSSLMEAIMKVISKITWLMGMENILTSMAINIKVSGKITYPMERVKPNTLMKVDTMANS